MEDMDRDRAYNVLMGCILRILKIYFRYFPFAAGKNVVWQRFVRPYVIWRDVPVDAQTRFGAVIRGRFPDILHIYLYFFGIWEPGVSRVFQRHLRPGDTVIDVGANVGAHTMLAASIVGAKGRVYAIEASPSIFSRLKENINRNGFRQVTPINLAAADTHSHVMVYLASEYNHGATTIVPDLPDQQANSEETQIEARPLGDIVPAEAIRVARLIKIDVEGAEWLVLRGMRDRLASLHQDCVVVLEITRDALSRFGANLDDVFALFAREGWEPFSIANSYKPEFYIHFQERMLSTALDLDCDVFDLGFARPTTLQVLMAADRP
jgi:FkbM family methyltransferase